jgi:hypothetical protein
VFTPEKIGTKLEITGPMIEPIPGRPNQGSIINKIRINIP